MCLFFPEGSTHKLLFQQSVVNDFDYKVELQGEWWWWWWFVFGKKSDLWSLPPSSILQSGLVLWGVGRVALAAVLGPVRHRMQGTCYMIRELPRYELSTHTVRCFKHG